MTRDELLLKLQPPSLPAEPGAWPPSLAWWLMLGLAIGLGIVWILWRVIRRTRQDHHAARKALAQIEMSYRQHQDPERLLFELAQWLRQVVQSSVSDPKLELHGEAWLDYLDCFMPEADFREGPGSVFGNRLYRANPQFDDFEVIQLCYRWLDNVHSLRGYRAAV